MRLAAIVVAAALALGVVIALVVTAGDGGEPERRVEGPDGAFTLEYPAGWSELPDAELVRLPGDELAAVRRDDRAAFVQVRAEPPVRGSGRTLERQLDRRLRRAFGDFRKVRAGGVRLEAGPAFSYSYARTRAGTAHSFVALPAGSRTWVLETTVRAGARDAAREAGQVVRSFAARAR